MRKDFILKEKRIIPVLLFLLLGLLCGCTPLDSVDNLMRPPKLSGENAGVQEAFERATANRTVHMKTPTTGAYRSAYVLYDLDGDGTEEAITFYSNGDDETAVYMHILDYTDAHWKSVADIKGRGSEVYKLDFCDMNGDGVSEIVVCWSLFESSGSQMLTIYTSALQSETPQVRELISEPFTQAVHTDLTGDGNDEVFLISVSSQDGKSDTVGRLLAMDSDIGIYCVASVDLVPSMRILSLQSQAADAQSGLPAMVFADCVLGDAKTVTEIVYWDSAKDRLCAPLTRDNRTDNPHTLRNTALPSTDADQDGLLEIPVLRALSDAVSVIAENIQPLDLTEWYGFDGTNLQLKKSALMFYSSAYSWSLSLEESKEFAVKNDVSERCCAFYQRTADGTRGEMLFEILTVPTKEWEHGADRAYTAFAENASLTYAYRITQFGKQSGVDAKYVQAHFSVIV